MRLLKQHPASTTLLVVNLFWWVLIIIYLFRNWGPGERCDLGQPLLLGITILMGIGYSIGFLLKAITSKEPFQTDYLIFLGLNSLPQIIFWAYLFSNS